MSIQFTVNKCAGGPAGKLDLSEATFAKEYNEPLIHQVVVAYQCGGRAGTRAQKNRSAVRGGGAKPWRQKGTGRARAGTICSPIFRGGGVTFAATTKDFSQKVNRNMYRIAMRSILSELHRQERLLVVDQLTMQEPSTKKLVSILATLGVTKALVVLSESDQNVMLSARNLTSISVCISKKIDPLSLISHDKVIVTAQAAKQIDEALSS